MPHRSGHARQHRSRLAIRRPHVPIGQRLVHERGWLTTDHMDACWYRIVDRRSDWSQVRLEVTAEPDDERQRLRWLSCPMAMCLLKRVQCVSVLKQSASSRRRSSLRSGAVIARVGVEGCMKSPSFRVVSHITFHIDRILDPLVYYHQTHPGFLTLWLKSQDDARLSAMGQDLNEALAQKTAWAFTRRYPQCDEASALRYSRICMQTVQALTVLAFKGPQVDHTVIAELKTMICAYLREVFRSEEGNAGNENGE